MLQHRQHWSQLRNLTISPNFQLHHFIGSLFYHFTMPSDTFARQLPLAHNGRTPMQLCHKLHQTSEKLPADVHEEAQLNPGKDLPQTAS